MSIWSSIKDAAGTATDWTGDGWDSISGAAGGITSGITDAAGLTDSGAADRAADAAASGISTANSQYDTDLDSLTGENGMFTTAQTRADGSSRDLGSNMDAYDTSMNSSNDLLNSTQDAGSASNVESYLNPNMDNMLAKTQQNVQGGAGAALQSSATTREAADQVSNQAGKMWDTAYNQAQTDAGNNQTVANTMATNANSQLQNDNTAALNWAGLEADKATQKYAGQVGVTEAEVGAAGERDTIL